MNRGLLILVLFCMSFEIFAQKAVVSGQAEAWYTIKPFDDLQSQLGGRYIPKLKYKYQFKDTSKFDLEASGNFYGRLDFAENTNDQNGQIKPYRIWTRYSTDNFELRIGLQKINFGSSTMLRPLMWFDKMDPRDPLQITDGVYGVLAKYYFKNNANIWLWGLIMNEELKGWEFYNSVKEHPEFGGRIQIPFLTGEMALSYHYRRICHQFETSMVAPPPILFSENRIGFDGKWDLIIGISVEGSIHNYDLDFLPYPWTKMFNLGIDYSFPVGNGLTTIHELLWMSSSKEFFESNNDVFLSALSLNYSISFMDNISAMVYYSYSTKDWYRILSYQRQYDRLSFYLMAYWNPDQFNLYQNVDGDNLFSGKGIQLRVVFNH